MVYGGCNGKVFGGVVIGEKWVCVDECVWDGMVDEDEETSPA